MTDPRVAKLADLLVNYSLELKPGEIVRLDGGTVATPFVRELYREALRAGANPRTRVEVEGIDVIAVGEASDEQLTFISEIDRFEIEKVDAIVTIWADRNTRALSQADPNRVSKKIAARRVLTNRLWERIDDGNAKWVGTRFPTNAHAQDAEMSLAEYEDFVYDRFTRDTLFDEKIGGTMHFALGSSFKKLGGRNESGLHWDMICDLRANGEVYADGELVWKAGHFLREPSVVAPEPVAAS